MPRKYIMCIGFLDFFSQKMIYLGRVREGERRGGQKTTLLIAHPLLAMIRKLQAATYFELTDDDCRIFRQFQVDFDLTSRFQSFLETPSSS